MKDEEKVEKISAFILKILSGENLSPDEQYELDEWLQRHPENKASFENMVSFRSFPEDMDHYMEITPSVEALEKQQSRIGYASSFRKYFIRGTVAAAVVLLLIISLYYYFPGKGSQLLQEQDARKNALISLVVDREKDSYVVGVNQEKKLNIPGLRRDSNVLVYDTAFAQIREIEYHTLQVGKGGEYQLTLSDGTKVWLNSESSLRYPKFFTGNSREVELKGEAFFEVASSNDRPFRVLCDEFSVDVLGTSFNIMNYPEEEFSRITLATGKLMVSHKTERTIISPSQQLSLNAEGFNINEVDIRYYTTWMGDWFMFEGETLEVITRKLTRWYGFDFSFEDDALKATRFQGALPKYDDISKVFELLEMTTNVQFIIQPKTISVMKKE